MPPPKCHFFNDFLKSKKSSNGYALKLKLSVMKIFLDSLLRVQL